MAEMPERIWVVQVHTTSIWANRAVGTWDERKETGGTEYVLASALNEAREALAFVRTSFQVEYAADGSPCSVAYDSDALRPVIARLDAALAKIGG